MSGYLDLVVIVQYYGPKAREFYTGSKKAMDILREDLLTLKLPHPKREKTLIRALPGGKGECSFMWAAVPTISTLRKHLSTRICGQDPEGARRRLLKELSICRLSLRESPGGTVTLDPQTIVWRTWGGAQAEAQMLLDDMASALQIPKSEPIEPSLPDSPRTPARIQDRDSVASSIPSPAAPMQLGALIGNVTRQSYTPLSVSSSKQTTPRWPIKVLAEPPVIPSLSLRPESSDLIPGLTFSSNRMPNHMQPSIVSRKRNRSSSPSDSRPCRPPPNSTRLLNGTNYHDTWSKIGRLEYELRSLRGQIDASLCRETSIVLELQALGHSAPPRETPQEIALREKLQKLEAQLQAETRMRIEAETALKDFQMECKEPFLVPALYDVVESISRLTTQVVGGIQQEVGERGLQN